MRSLFKILFCGVILCFSTYNLFALTVGGTAPSGVTGVLDSDLQAAFDLALADAETELQKYDNQPDLARGFANANAFAAQAATIQGFQDYTLFAVSTGVMASAQFPSYDKEYYDDIDEKIKNDGDINAGVGASLAYLNFGINAGFIYPGLYLNAKFGYISMNDIADKVSIKSTLVGLGANYTWISSVGVLGGLAKWRGISFGTGLLYNYNKTDVKIDMDELSAQTIGGGPYQLILTPSFVLGVESHTFTVPVDVMTSVQLLWVLNFTLGTGIDFTFGKTDINLNADGDIAIDGYAGAYTPGSFYINGGTKGQHPSFAHYRINSGIGFNIAVVKIDVPIVWYPFDKAAAVGVTAGVVW